MTRIKGLDGLRAIAFLLVFIYHAHFGYFGWVGVQLFFVLSGFLITGILFKMKEALPVGAYLLKFYGRRVLRIVPLYYLYLFLVWLIVTAMMENHVRRTFTQIFQQQFPYALYYVYDFMMATNKYEIASSFLTHLWSLAVEEQFYLVWPFVVFLTPQKYLKKVFLTAVGLAPLFRLIALLFYQHTTIHLLQQNPDVAVYALPFSHLDAFAMGALLNLLPNLPRAKAQFLILLAALPLAGMLTDFLATGQWNPDYGFGLPILLPYAFRQVWGYSALNYLFMLLIYGVAKEGWFTRFLEWPVLSYLGKISYGLYVYHYSLLWLTGAFILPDASNLLIALTALPLTILVAALSYHGFERPLTNLKDRWFALRSQKAVI